MSIRPDYVFRPLAPVFLVFYAYLLSMISGTVLYFFAWRRRPRAGTVALLGFQEEGDDTNASFGEDPYGSRSPPGAGAAKTPSSASQGPRNPTETLRAQLGFSRSYFGDFLLFGWCVLVFSLQVVLGILLLSMYQGWYFVFNNWFGLPFCPVWMLDEARRSGSPSLPEWCDANDPATATTSDWEFNNYGLVILLFWLLSFFGLGVLFLPGGGGSIRRWFLVPARLEKAEVVAVESWRLESVRPTTDNRRPKNDEQHPGDLLERGIIAKNWSEKDEPDADALLKLRSRASQVRFLEELDVKTDGNQRFVLFQCTRFVYCDNGGLASYSSPDCGYQQGRFHEFRNELQMNSFTAGAIGRCFSRGWNEPNCKRYGNVLRPLAVSPVSLALAGKMGNSRWHSTDIEESESSQKAADPRWPHARPMTNSFLNLYYPKTRAVLKRQQRLFGPNVINLDLPSFVFYLKKEMLSFVTLVQLVALWAVILYGQWKVGFWSENFGRADSFWTRDFLQEIGDLLIILGG